MSGSVILMRHAPVIGAQGLCYGRLDLPAAEPPMLPRGMEGRPVWSSPAARCRALADRIAPGSVRLDPRLQELDFGRWEGRPWNRIERAESDPWAADPWRVAPPDGETFAALYARVAAALAEAPEGCLLVTHAGPIRAARMILAGQSFEAAFAAPVPYALPIRLERAAA